MSLKPVTAPALLATFASASACIDRLARTIPVEVVEIVDDPKTWRLSGPRRHGFRWTGYEDDELRRLWLGGASGSTMADHLGRTRDAVWSRIDVIKWGET